MPGMRGVDPSAGTTPMHDRDHAEEVRRRMRATEIRRHAAAGRAQQLNGQRVMPADPAEKLRRRISAEKGGGTMH